MHRTKATHAAGGSLQQPTPWRHGAGLYEAEHCDRVDLQDNSVTASVRHNKQVAALAVLQRQESDDNDQIDLQE